MRHIGRPARVALPQALQRAPPPRLPRLRLPGRPGRGTAQGHAAIRAPRRDLGYVRQLLLRSDTIKDVAPRPVRGGDIRVHGAQLARGGRGVPVPSEAAGRCWKALQRHRVLQEVRRSCLPVLRGPLVIHRFSVALLGDSSSRVIQRFSFHGSLSRGHTHSPHGQSTLYLHDSSPINQP